MFKDYYGWIVSAFYFIVGIFCIFFFDGTGDSGDSIYHYLIAKYAPDHPELFFSHWGKPLFTLLASPFAQFGFNGIKFFNLIVACVTIFFTYKTAKITHPKSAWISPLFLFTSTLFFVLTFSGLTEHLFALITLLGFYYFLKDNYLLASILISLLPFVRSEGLIIIGVFAFALILKKQWKSIPFLSLGHIIFAVAGSVVHHDILWVFNKIPYVIAENPYGHGDLFHFVIQLNFVIGLPLYILFWLGFIIVIGQLIKKKIPFSRFSLIFGIPIAFLVAHSIFWYFGIFNSMGLIRVLVDVSPFFILIALYPVESLLNFNLSKKTKTSLTAVIVLIIFLFHLTPNNTAIHWDKDLSLNSDQQCILDIKSHTSQIGHKNTIFIYSHPYINEAFNIDPFIEAKQKPLNIENIENASIDDLIIWDSFSVYNAQEIKNNYLERAPYVEVFHCKNDKNEFIVFKRNE